METAQPAAVHAVTGIVGRERVRAFDLAAGLAVFFMILVHVLWHWGAPETWTTPIGEAISYRCRARPRRPSSCSSWAPRSAPRRERGSGTLAAPGALARPPRLRAQLPARRDPRQPRPRDRGHHRRAGRPIHDLVAGHDRRPPPRGRPVADRRSRCSGRASQPGWLWLALAGALVLVAPSVADVTFGTPVLDAPLTPFLGVGAQRLLRGRALARLPAGRRGLRRDDRAIRRSGRRSSDGLPSSGARSCSWPAAC